MLTQSDRWCLLRTKAGEERRARDQVSRFATEVLLPLVKVRIRRRSRLVESLAPLFPGYLFARLDAERESARLRYTRGLRGFVPSDAQPAEVPGWIINELRERCMRGPVELPGRILARGDRVLIVDGPFQEFEGIFERYIGKRERVAILLSIVNGGARIVLPGRALVAVCQ
jgi:transcriptional antiterminator RfaH